MELESLLKKPKSEYGDVIVWLINGTTSLEQTACQMRIFAQMGLSGVCLRAGAEFSEDYTSAQWLDFIKECIWQAKLNNLKIYLSDDVTLSGTAGGLATATPKYRAKYITYDIIEPDKFSFTAYGNETLGIYGVNVIEGGGEERLAYYYKINNILELRRGDSVMVVKTTKETANAKINGMYEPDLLSREAFDYFMSIRHEWYKEELKEWFNETLVGICTQIGVCTNKTGKDGKLYRPYTETIEDEFYKMYGYPLVSRLPELFFTAVGETYSSVAQSYVETVKSTYEKNRLIPYSQWCKTNNIKLIGISQSGDDLFTEGRLVSDRMRMLSHTAIPVVCAPNLESATYKYLQVSSLKAQNNKEECVCETFGGMGKNATYNDYRISMDVSALFGVDKRFYSSALYTLAGEGKREETDVGYHCAGYEDFETISSYGARLNALNKITKPLTSSLVLYGIEDMSGKCTKRQAQNNLNVFSSTYDCLLDNLVDFDLACEKQLCDNAKVIGLGKKTRLVIGSMQYSTVFVAGLQNVNKKTVKLLTEFAKNGGKCIFVENVPTYVDGNFVNFTKLPLYAYSKVRSVSVLLGSDANKALPFTLHESGEGNLCAKVRQFEDGSYYVFAFNRNNENIIKATMMFSFNAEIQKISLDSGKVSVAEYINESDTTVLSYEFEPLTSLALRVIPIQSESVSGKKQVKLVQAGEKIKLPEEFEYNLSEPNVLVHDAPTVYVNGKLKGKGEVVSVGDFLKEQYGLYKNGTYQPWYKTRVLRRQGRAKKADLVLKYDFFIRDIPLKVCLALERHDLYAVSLNGNKIAHEKNGSYLDETFNKIDLPVSLLTIGRNELVLEADLCDELPIEQIYLVGNFGVNVIRNDGDFDSYEITTLPKTLKIGDVTTQGLPFYGGKIYYYLPLVQGAYSFKFSRHHTWLMAKIRTVDDSKTIAFAPFEDEIYSDFAERDYERIESLGLRSVYESEPMSGVQIEVTLSRRNTFGPLRYEDNLGRSAKYASVMKEPSKSILLGASGLDYLLVKRLPLGLNKQDE